MYLEHFVAIYWSCRFLQHISDCHLMCACIIYRLDIQLSCGFFSHGLKNKLGNSSWVLSYNYKSKQINIWFNIMYMNKVPSRASKIFCPFHCLVVLTCCSPVCFFTTFLLLYPCLIFLPASKVTAFSVIGGGGGSFCFFCLLNFFELCFFVHLHGSKAHCTQLIWILNKYRHTCPWKTAVFSHIPIPLCPFFPFCSFVSDFSRG